MCCFTIAHVSREYNSTDITMHWKTCILTKKVKALEDQMLTSYCVQIPHIQIFRQTA